MQTSSQDNFTIEAKKRLIDLRLSVTGLAIELGFARNTVSMALNHPVLPTVRRKIAQRLKLKHGAAR